VVLILVAPRSADLVPLPATCTQTSNDCFGNEAKAKSTLMLMGSASVRYVGFVAASDRDHERTGHSNANKGDVTLPASPKQRDFGNDRWAYGTFAADANAHLRQRPALRSLAEMKARQVAKMREIRDALVAEGCANLDDQAAALGLSRSTTWTIMSGSHKGSGLSATILTRMLSAPRLQPRVRKKILEYVAEKSAGHYGTSQVRLEKFNDRVRQHSSGGAISGSDLDDRGGAL